MADRQDRLPKSDNEPFNKDNAVSLGKNKTKSNLMDYARQLTFLGILQQAVVRNLQERDIKYILIKSLIGFTV